MTTLSLDDPLDVFLDSFFKNRLPIGCVPLHNAVKQIEGGTSVIWYRDPQFQIQMFILPPNFLIPEHTHPNVDSYEVYVGGQIRFSHSGKWQMPEEDMFEADAMGFSRNRGTYKRVRPNDLHGGMSGPGGGVFMSVQRWLNGVEPHCITDDYTGILCGTEHLESVKNGSATYKDQSCLTIKDLAHLES
jgi:hypothetical protein